LQVFATIFYVLFAAVTYVYLGSEVQSPSIISLSPKWAKAAWGWVLCKGHGNENDADLWLGLLLPNLLVSGSLYNHTAAKILFVRIFRNSHHLHSNTLLAWAVWIALLVTTSGVGFVLAIAVPVRLARSGLRQDSNSMISFSPTWLV